MDASHETNHQIYFPPVPESYEVVPQMPAVSQPAHNPIKQVSAGTRHSLAVAESGHAYSWGLGRE
jgi:regulator of chromosome condensation